MNRKELAPGAVQGPVLFYSSFLSIYGRCAQVDRSSPAKVISP